MRHPNLRRGMYFEHRLELNADSVRTVIETNRGEPKPQIFKITAIRQGTVYYRPLYRDDGVQWLGVGYCSPIDDFEKFYLGKWLPEGPGVL